MIGALIENGTISLIAIAVIVAEVAILLTATRRRPSLSRIGLVANGLSGICLMLALRAALTGAGTAWVGLWLGLSLAAHLGDVIARLRA